MMTSANEWKILQWNKKTLKQTNKDNLFDHFLPVEEEYEYKFSSEERFILGD